jgi:sugar lactone lactonase YvrE
MPLRLALAALLASTGVALAQDAVVIDDDAGFPEGPFVEDGVLYYTEYGAHTVSTWDGSKLATLWTQEGCGPSAVRRFGEGFLVTCYDNGTLALVAADGASATAIDKDDRGDPLVGPNDIVLDGKGGAYATTSGPWDAAPIVGAVLHVSPDGGQVVADDLHYANGIALSADGAMLFVVEHYANRVISFTVNADGSLSDRRMFVRLSDLDEPADALPDGIKLGPDGNLYIGLYSAGRIIVVDNDGKLIRKIAVPSATAPNLTFSEDGKTLFVMAVDDTANPPYKGKVYSLALD